MMKKYFHGRNRISVPCLIFVLFLPSYWWIFFANPDARGRMVPKEPISGNYEQLFRGEEVSELERSVPLYVITPTYPRRSQMADMTRLGQTLKVQFYCTVKYTNPSAYVVYKKGSYIINCLRRLEAVVRWNLEQCSLA